MAAYLLLLRAVKVIAKRDAVLEKRVIVFAGVAIAAYVAVLPAYFPNIIPITAAGFLILGAVFGVGIASIYLGRELVRMAPELGEYSRKAGSWCQISGWLMATLILMILGVLMSLVADYYMWKLVRQEARRS